MEFNEKRTIQRARETGCVVHDGLPYFFVDADDDGQIVVQGQAESRGEIVPTIAKVPALECQAMTIEEYWSDFFPTNWVIERSPRSILIKMYGKGWLFQYRLRKIFNAFRSVNR